MTTADDRRQARRYEFSDQDLHPELKFSKGKMGVNFDKDALMVGTNGLTVRPDYIKTLLAAELKARGL